jgi:2-phospho-L-lactate guanylyltransferase
VPAILAILPLKGFDRAKERLGLAPDQRAAFAAATATIVATACEGAGLDLAVVTADDAVARWAADRGATVVPDPGRGLDDAAAAGVAAAVGRPWVVIHGDLPLLTADDLAAPVEALGSGTAVLAPSRDGGTNLLGSTSTITFRYGPASFARHLAAVGGARHLIVVRTGTAVEVDTVPDLVAAASLPGGGWLRRFLP